MVGSATTVIVMLEVTPTLVELLVTVRVYVTVPGDVTGIVTVPFDVSS
jgi:hypothetical protein